MTIQYKVNVYDTNGTLQAVFTNWSSLYLERYVNEIDTHQFSFILPDTRVTLFELDALVEVMRSDLDAGIDWYTEYIGFHRTSQSQLTERNKRIFTSYGRSLKDLLHRRTVLYPAGSIYTNKTGAADDVMKAFVRENAGTLATSPPRYQSGVTSGFVVAPDTTLGPTWTGQRSYPNLFNVLREIAIESGVDYDVVYTGPAAFEFRTYYPQLGTDRSASSSDPMIFAAEFGTLTEEYYTSSRIDEGNSVIVLGQGQEDNRDYVIRTSAATVDSPWNLAEVVRDARQEEATNGLNAVGDAALEDLQARNNFFGRVVQTPAARYGRDYFLGDVVTVRLFDVTLDKKIIRVTIVIEEGREVVNIEFGDIA